MPRDRRSFFVPMLSLLLLGLAPAVVAEPSTDQAAWPRWSGPNFDLSTATGQLGDGPVELEVAWTIELGSGYSGIVVADGKVITGFTDESANGDFLSKTDDIHRLEAPTIVYKGENSSSPPFLSLEDPRLYYYIQVICSSQGGM